MKTAGLIVATVLLSAHVFPAEPQSLGETFAQCLSRCEPGKICEPKELDEFSNIDDALLEIEANCQSNDLFYTVAIEGMCADGKRILNTGTGFSNEVRFYDSSGEFEGLFLQTDYGTQPCLGQYYWPRLLQCEAPRVVTTFCRLSGGFPAFYDRWQR